MWDADLSTDGTYPRLASEVAAVRELRRASRSLENLSNVTAARRPRRVDGLLLFPAYGTAHLICRHLKAGTNVAHTCSGKGLGTANHSIPCDVCSLDVGVAASLSS